MSKLTGLEWGKFYNDPEFWPEGRWHEDEELLIDGVNAHEADLDLTKVPDTAALVLRGGMVFDADSEEVCSLEALFKRWKKKQTTTALVIDCPNEKLDQLLASLNQLGISHKR